MNEKQKRILLTSVEICDAIVNSIEKRNRGQYNCKSYCPGEDKLISTLNQLIDVFKDIEAECCSRLCVELSKIKILW